MTKSIQKKRANYCASIQCLKLPWPRVEKKNGLKQNIMTKKKNLRKNRKKNPHGNL